MPQLVRGGEYVFGWSKVSDGGRISIPQEARDEYGLKPWEKVIVMSGSRRSGGFAVSTPGLLAGSPLATALNRFPRLRTFQMPEARVVRVEGMSFCWTSIDEEGYLTLPEATLREYGILPGDRLLAVRGSGVALGFALRGPVVDAALTHAGLEVFE
jgi:bifunctional DNA-binding transcriptional regulator/antitoxin component of YhaV-PrlF toxin-antitoxin module